MANGKIEVAPIVIVGLVGGIGVWAYSSYRKRKEREEMVAAATAIAKKAQESGEPWSEKTLSQKVEEEFGEGMRLAREFHNWITS